MDFILQLAWKMVHRHLPITGEYKFSRLTLFLLIPAQLLLIAPVPARILDRRKRICLILQCTPCYTAYEQGMVSRIDGPLNVTVKVPQGTFEDGIAAG